MACYCSNMFDLSILIRFSIMFSVSCTCAFPIALSTVGVMSSWPMDESRSGDCYGGTIFGSSLMSGLGASMLSFFTLSEVYASLAALLITLCFFAVVDYFFSSSCGITSAFAFIVMLAGNFT